MKDQKWSGRLSITHIDLIKADVGENTQNTIQDIGESQELDVTPTVVFCHLKKIWIYESI